MRCYYMLVMFFYLIFLKLLTSYMDTVPQEFFYQEDLIYQQELKEAPGSLYGKMAVHVSSSVCFHQSEM